MTERRYTEDEVARIFERAADPEQASRRRLAAGEGLTLGELQEIGREVGIAPEAVEDAARSLEKRPERPTRRTLLGFPIGVGRTAQLDRHLSDREWERLVVDLRETFDARGSLRTHGSFREWTNGNLQALVEPTADGDRIRLRTFREQSRLLMFAGSGMFGLGGVALLTRALSGAMQHGGGGLTSLFLIGLGLFGLGAFRLPRWARLRGRQMDGILARLEAAAAESARPESTTSDQAAVPSDTTPPRPTSGPPRSTPPGTD